LPRISKVEILSNQAGGTSAEGLLIRPLSRLDEDPKDFLGKTQKTFSYI